MTSCTQLIVGLLLVISCTGQAGQSRTEEIVFHSGPFKLVGDLRLPERRGPHPVVVFVHGDGPNTRTSGVTYPPIMARMQRAGYATFAWDKPGTGESTGRIDRSRLMEQRAQIVLDAIAVLKARPDIDGDQIGLWGISQAGYVMPHVLARSADVAFMIAVSCPGEPGFEQGIYLVTAQARCAGLPEEDAEQVQYLIGAASRAQTYDEFVHYKAQLADYPALRTVSQLGFNVDVQPEEDWHADDLEGDYFWDPITIIEQTTIPVLAFFGERDTQADPVQGAQAYRAALQRAGNPNFRVELIPGVDHNIILSETGCLDERRHRRRREWTNYAPEYLDTLEEWLRSLRR
ncbi:MAG: alpha/beta fold hydrolase [Gemmatimonadota bacterium]|nr:MAG: alpha/beta fold hydrolase [Gemmatimonadota bacterium]